MYQANPTLHRRLALLNWALPIVLGCLAVFYEIGPGRWLHDAVGAYAYFNLDIIFYATLMPLLVFVLLFLMRRWFERAERAENLAQTSERRLGAIMAASADAILSLDASGRIESWNRGAELLFGFSAALVQGQPMARLFGSGESAEVEYHWLSEAVQQQDFVRGHETTCHGVGGRSIAVELTATRMDDDRGGFAGMSVVLRDITERRHREEEIRRLNTSLSDQVAERTRELDEKVQQLRQANATLQVLDRMRSEFVSVVSHQIRAPLTNMRGAAERMRSSCGAINSTCGRMFVVLDQQVDRLDRLVQSVLNTARIEAGELALEIEPMSVLPVIQQVVDQAGARSSERPIHTPTKPGLPLVMADRDRVSEVLTNLLDNADKYSSPGQEISIDVQADQAQVAVSVRDHGRGLPSGDTAHLFDKFYRADSSDSQMAYGYGLGLYVCRRLIEAQGGRIWAENAPDGGAVFTFTLPVLEHNP